MDDRSNKGGVTLLIDCLNNTDFNIILDFNNPDESAFKTFAFLLSLTERGKSFPLIMEKIQQVIENDEINAKYIDKILEYKQNIDSNLDVPAVLPREVFRKK